MLLPVTFNGIGTSQAAFVWFFAQCRRAAPRRRSRLSVLFVALGIVGNLPGGILYAFGHSAAGRRSRAIMTRRGRRLARRLLKGARHRRLQPGRAASSFEIIVVLLLHVAAARRRVAAAGSPHHPAGLPAFQPIADPVRPAMRAVRSRARLHAEAGNVHVREHRVHEHLPDQPRRRARRGRLARGAGGDRARRFARDGMGRRAGGGAAAGAGPQERPQGAERGGLVLRHRA